jgi:hypothetical protein
MRFGASLAAALAAIGLRTVSIPVWSALGKADCTKADLDPENSVRSCPSSIQHHLVEPDPFPPLLARTNAALGPSRRFSLVRNLSALKPEPRAVAIPIQEAVLVNSRSDTTNGATGNRENNFQK